MKTIAPLLVVLTVFFLSHAQPITPDQYKMDFAYLWSTIEKNYCYWDKKQTDWNQVKELYTPIVDTITSKGSFVHLLENVFYELYDHNASLSTNTSESQRLIPSSTDMWAEYVGDEPTTTEVRSGLGAQKAGLKAGMRILAFNDGPIELAIQPLLAKALKKEDIEAKNFAFSF